LDDVGKVQRPESLKGHPEVITGMLADFVLENLDLIHKVELH